VLGAGWVRARSHRRPGRHRQDIHPAQPVVGGSQRPQCQKLHLWWLKMTSAMYVTCVSSVLWLCDPYGTCIFVHRLAEWDVCGFVLLFSGYGECSWRS
jgi:hypothetical protein